MSAAAAKIAEIEAEMARTQKNKATARHIGLLKAKLAKLRTELITGVKAGSGGAVARGFDVTKSGDTRVGLMGFPSVGKSTLLVKLTGTFSEVAAYEFTTLTAIPGVLKFKGAKIQILDLPGIIEGAKDGKGRGRQVIGTARTCDMLLIVIDASKSLVQKKLLEHELEGFGIRINKKPPNVVLTRKEKGGIGFRSTFPQKELDQETVEDICKEYKIHSADIQVRQANVTVDELIDVIEGNRVYMPALFVLNKIDSISIEELELLSQVPHYVPISAASEWNFDELLEKMWEYLDLVRIYTKPKGQIPDYDNPIVLHSESRSVGDLCYKIHKTFIQQFRYAWVWGRSVKHQPQKVGKVHVLEDEDVAQLVKKT